MKVLKTIFIFLNFLISNRLCFSQIQLDCGNFIPTQIVDSCSQTKSIKLGSISSKKLKGNYEIPKEIYELKKLEEIYIYNLPVTQISSGIANLKNLKLLFIMNSKISSLPFEISTLDSISSLYIINGKIKAIPEPLLKLKNLRSLSIQGNNEFIYDSLGYHLLNSNINEICLGNKWFKKLDSSFVNLHNIEFIQICFGNQVDYHSLIQTLNQLKNLKTIQFKQCRFTKNEIQFLEKIRPNVKLQFVNCKVPKNAVNELRILLKNTNEVINGDSYKPKSYGSF